MGIILSIFVVITLTHLYRRYKTEDEDYLVVKLIGYYLLGGFKYNFDGIALPIGFLINIAFLKPTTNKTMKKCAAEFGLLMFFLGLVTPNIESAYVQRDRHVPISSSNIYTMDFEGDYKAILEKLKVNSRAKIGRVNIQFDQSGEIENLYYMFITKNNKKIRVYNVRTSKYDSRYTVSPRMVDWWSNYDRLVNDETFFKMLEKVKLKELMEDVGTGEYTLQCYGDYMNSGFSSYQNYLITEDGNIKAEEELPERGHSIIITGHDTRSGRITINKEFILSVD